MALKGNWGWDQAKKDAMKEKIRASLRARAKVHQPAVKLTETQVREIKAKLKEGLAPSSLAKYYGVGKQTIYDIKHGETWKHIDG